MADVKISALTALTTFASGDLLVIVDVSDTTMAVSGTDKKLPVSTLTTYLGTLYQPLSADLTAFVDNATWNDINLTMVGGLTLGDSLVAPNLLSLPGGGLTVSANTVLILEGETGIRIVNLATNGLVTTSGSDGTLSVTVPGTGVLAFLATPSGANLATALTTALPATKGGTGLTALGTGVTTAIGINVGSAGAFVTLNGALGTPASGTLTNCSGLPIAGIASLGTGVATALAANVNGSGAITLTTSPAFVTPVLGAATATSLAIGSAALTASGSVLTNSGGIVSGGGFTAAATAVLELSGRSGFRSPTDGTLTLYNNANSDFTSLQFGGTGAGFPSLRRNGTTVAFRTSDNSADSPITVSNLTASGYVATGIFTVATAPAASLRARFLVSDANATTFMSTVAGGGSNIVPCFGNGTNNIIG